MGFFSSVVDWAIQAKNILTSDVRDLFKGTTTAAKAAKEVVKAPSVESLKKELENQPEKATPETTLNKAAREKLALGSVELAQKKDEAPKKVTCSHSYSLNKQVWVKIAKKKYELRNDMVCLKCESHEVVSV